MATYDPSESGNYYILGDTNAEMVQLIDLDRYFNKSMGGLLPEQPDQVISRLHDVLDVACGPGGWVLELAQAYPHMQVSGIDISQGMIDYATVQAHASGLDNTHFRVANALEPLDFPDHSFDLVNARQLEGVIPTASWPVMVKEMFRITRPGGIIRLTGNEWDVSNSPALEEFNERILRGFLAFGLNHVPDDRNYGIAAWLSSYLRDAGCVNIQERPSFMDISAGAKQPNDGYKLFTVSAELIEPFFLSAGVTTKQDHERLKRQLSLEMLEDSFRGIVYTLTAWGQKP